MNNFYSFLIDNPIIIETLFNMNNYEIKNIDSNKRIIIKTFEFNNIYNYLPIIKSLVIKNQNDISFIIKEKFINNDFIIYKIKLNKHPLIDNYDFIYKFKFYIFISFYNNKLNIILKNKDIKYYDLNCFKLTIFNIIKNYLDNDFIIHIKKNILEKNLKPLLANLNPHSFELNII
jgi:hypothetical protein